MTEYEVIRLLGETVALLCFVLGSVWYIARQVWRVLEATRENTAETRQLKEHQMAMNGHVAAHNILDDTRFGAIGERLSHIEGRLGLPPRPDQKNDDRV